MHWMRANGKHTKKCPAYRTRPTPHTLKIATYQPALTTWPFDHL